MLSTAIFENLVTSRARGTVPGIVMLSSVKRVFSLTYIQPFLAYSFRIWHGLQGN